MSTSTRRAFVRTAALGASSVLVRAPAEADEANDAKPAAPLSEAEARMELIVARFGKHLDAAARDTVRAEVEATVRRAELLRKFPLTNGDAPFSVFTPYRAPLGKE